MNRDYIFYVLKERCKFITAYPMLNPDKIVNIANDYLSSGCKSNSDYKELVIYSIENIYIRNELLNA